MRLVFISSVIATTVLRMTSAVKASTVAFIGVFSSFMDYYFNVWNRLNYLNRPLRPSRSNRSIRPTARIPLPFPPVSPNHLVRPHQHVRRNRQANLLGGFQIDDELEFRRLLDRKIGGFRTFENFVHKNRYPPVAFGAVGSIGHQTTIGNETSLYINRRQPISCRQLRDLFLIGRGQWGRQHGESAATRPDGLFERVLIFVGAAYFHRMKLQAEFGPRVGSLSIPV